jgi:hypothetical protein
MSKQVTTIDEVLRMVSSYTVIELCGDHLKRGVLPTKENVRTVIDNVLSNYDALCRTSMSSLAGSANLPITPLEALLTPQTPESALVQFCGYRSELKLLMGGFTDEQYATAYEQAVVMLIEDYNNLLVNATDGDVEDGLMKWLRAEGLRRGYEVTEDKQNIKAS